MSPHLPSCRPAYQGLRLFERSGCIAQPQCNLMGRCRAAGVILSRAACGARHFVLFGISWLGMVLESQLLWSLGRQLLTLLSCLQPRPAPPCGASLCVWCVV